MEVVRHRRTRPRGADDVVGAPLFKYLDETAREVSLRAPIALLENDGVLVLGANVLEAFDRLEVLESTSEALVNSRLIGEVAPMSDEVIDDLKRAFASMLA